MSDSIAVFLLRVVLHILVTDLFIAGTCDMQLVDNQDARYLYSLHLLLAR